MLKSIVALKQLARSYKPVPHEFSPLAPSKTPLEKLNSIYSSPQLASQLHLPAVQKVVFAVAPPAPPHLLIHSPESIPTAIRSYLKAKDLEASFSSLQYLPDPPHSYLHWGGFFIGIISGIIWQGPIGVLLAIYWSGLGLVYNTGPSYRFVEWMPSTPHSKRSNKKIALCDHIVAWYEDYLGVTTENWHRRSQEATVSEVTLTRLLAQHGLKRAARGADHDYADYWGHHDGFDWREPDQDPVYFAVGDER